MKIYKLIYILIASVIIFLMILSFNKDNAFTIETQVIELFSPQGYAFFTRDPKESQFYIYEIKNSRQLKNICQNSSTSEMLFGLSRKNSRLSYDFSEIISGIHNWKSLDKIEDFYLLNTDTLIISKKDVLSLKGNYLIIKEERVPWAWSKNINSQKKQFKLISIK